MGRIAVSLLLRLLEHRRGEGMSIELQTRLIVRDSTAAPGPASKTEGELAVG
jgi:DNA-binding LacI/PurR family transcriptional regulator